jgi:flagellin
MAISSINNQLNTNYEHLSTMKRINSAADDAAGLSIAESLKSQSNGYDVASNNAANSKNMLNVADGALSSISDSLQRIRELSLQASNSIYTNDDKASIQSEIDQLKQHINYVAGNTEYNTKKLLDGSVTSVNTTLSANGSSMNTKLPNSTLDALGIADYDVTGDFDIQKIDDAIRKVSSSRSSIGASTNALDYAYSNSQYTSQNLKSARSRIEDLDVPSYISDMNKNRILNEYRLFVQSSKTGQATRGISILLGSSS